MATRDYLVRMPKDTTVKAACEDIGCEQWRDGWESHIDESRDCGAGPMALCAYALAGQMPCGTCQAQYIRHLSGRTFTELKGAGVTVFRFASGQRCFAEHRTRPARLAVRTGVLLRPHASLADMAEDYTEHIGRLEAAIQRG
jgi:hypothetical protein